MQKTEILSLTHLSNTQRQQLNFLLGRGSDKADYPILAQVSGDSSITEAFEIPSKPWESLDRSEVQPDPADETEFKNIGSVSFEHFDVKLLRTSFGTDDHLYCKHMMDDSPAGSVFSRDWREARLQHLRRPISIVTEAVNMEENDVNKSSSQEARGSTYQSSSSLFSPNGSIKTSPSSVMSSNSTGFSQLSEPRSIQKRKNSVKERPTNKRARTTNSSTAKRTK